ncbi:MAG: hypothetical protein OHK0029_28500 [Armatimonadaceae bacterium]
MAEKRVLIVEDNPVNMELATDLLEVAGYQVLQAEDAETGINLAKSELPDLVLMDIALPGMDGLTATTILRQDLATAHIPIVALTAQAMRGDEDKAITMGCIGYITKPINTRAFPKLVAEYSEKKNDGPLVLSQTADTAPVEISVEKAPAPAVEKPRITPVLVEEDNPLFQDRVVEPLLGFSAVAKAPSSDAGKSVPAIVESEEEAKGVRKSGAGEPATPFLRLEPLAEELLATWEQEAGPAAKQTAKQAEPTAAPDELQPIASDDIHLPTVPVGPTGAPTLTLTEEPVPVSRAAADEEPFVILGRKKRGGRKRQGIAIVSEVSSAKILVVDDDELNREMITAQLRLLGYDPVVAEDGFQALDAVDESFDLVLLDYMMPGMDGCQVCQQIREEKHLMDLPVIMVTALSNREDQLRAVQVGANDWITKPVDRTELQVRVKAHLKFKAAQDALRHHQRELESTVRARTADLRKALEQVTREQERTEEAYLDTMHRLALAAEFRDGFMAAAHIRCVGNYCAAIARGMGLPENVAEVLLHAAPIHDIGMLGVPEHIIRKTDPRTAEEEAAFQEHTVLGARLLSGARSELLRAGEVIALSHHEKWDGSGYPHGRSGEAIPLYGRICAVADTFDTITSFKGDEWQATNEEAKEVLLAGRGTDFDPAVVDAFFKQWAEIETYQKRYRRTEAPPEDLFPRKLVA